MKHLNEVFITGFEITEDYTSIEEVEANHMDTRIIISEFEINNKAPGDLQEKICSFLSMLNVTVQLFCIKFDLNEIQEWAGIYLNAINTEAKKHAIVMNDNKELSPQQEITEFLSLIGIQKLHLRAGNQVDMNGKNVVADELFE